MFVRTGPATRRDIYTRTVLLVCAEKCLLRGWRQVALFFHFFFFPSINGPFSYASRLMLTDRCPK